MGTEPVRKRTLVEYAPYVSYGGITITFDDYADIFDSLVTFYRPHIAVLGSWVAHSSFDADVRRIFNDVDRDRNGTLDWNSREIDAFIKRLLTLKGLPHFGEMSIYNLYRAFDRDSNYKLDVQEAKNLAHALFSGIVYFGNKRGYVQRSTGPAMPEPAMKRQRATGLAIPRRVA